MKKDREDFNEEFDIVSIGNDNSKWELSIPTYEALMIKKAVSLYEASSIGYSEEEYTDAIINDHEYQNIKRFYSSVPFPTNGMYSRFDPNLTMEEAVKKYIGCDMETVEQIHEKIKESKRNGILWEKNIKEKYTGDLSTQLGMDKEPFVKDAEKIDEATKKMTEMLNKVAKMNRVGTDKNKKNPK